MGPGPDCGSPPRCVIIVQAPGSGYGKTLMAERIVEALAGHGIPVIALKHVHHESPDLLEGKDAERLYRAGAAASIALASKTALVVLQSPRDPVGAASCIARAMGLNQYVLVVEGFRGMPLEGDCRLTILERGPGMVAVECSGRAWTLPAGEAVAAAVEACVEAFRLRGGEGPRHSDMTHT